MNIKDWAFLDKCGYKLLNDNRRPIVIKSKLRFLTLFPLFLFLTLLSLELFAIQSGIELNCGHVLFVIILTLFVLSYVHDLVNQAIGKITIADGAITIKKFRCFTRKNSVRFDEIDDVEMISRGTSSRSPSSRISIQLRLKDGTEVKLFYFGAIHKKEYEKLNSLVGGLKREFNLLE